MARLERYIALAFDAGVTPVVLLTKSDLCEDPGSYVEQAQTISRDVVVLTLKAPRATSPGKNCALVQAGPDRGVPGLVRRRQVDAHQCAVGHGIRRHASHPRGMTQRGATTTSHRQLHILPDGCAVLDTPGVRELQLTDAEAGVAEVFSDLDELATRCRFNDCGHMSEPGCAVQAALKAGSIEEARLARWRKAAGRRPAQHRKPRPAPLQGQGLRQDGQAGQENTNRKSTDTTAPCV